MLSLKRRLAVAGLGLAAVAGPLAVPAGAHAVTLAHSRIQTGPQAGSTPEIHHDTSPPLADLSNTSAARLPGRPQIPDAEGPLPHPGPSGVADPVVQGRQGAAGLPMTILRSFDGIGSANYPVSYIPPDPNAAVGTTQVFEIVNAALAVYSKNGGTILAPFNTNALWAGFGGYCQTDNAGDGTVTWDRIHNRWLIQQFANVNSTTGSYYECVAISTGPDATGTYHRYAYQFSDFPDYPKTAVWPGSYFVTYNMFSSAGAFVGGRVCAMDQTSMLIGAAASQQCFTSTYYGGLLAGDMDGSTPPPAGEDETVVALGGTATSLAVWRFHVDWANPANSAFTGPAPLTVAPYTTACGGIGPCVPQAATSERLDALSDRLMYRLAYRNFGDHESLVVSHSVAIGAGTGMRWYELRMSGGHPAVHQQGTYAPDSSFRWMGSAAQDKAGDIVLGYSQSSGVSFPSIRITGRNSSDPPGTMTQPEATLFTGSGSQTTYSRWGDYTSMSIDPTDDCTFWYTDEYQPAFGSFNWQTRLAAFQMPGCVTPTFSIGTQPAARTVSVGRAVTTTVSATAIGGDTETVALTATGLPAGTTATFQPSSISVGGTATLTLAASPTTPVGTYQVTVSGTGTSGTHGTAFPLTVTTETCTTPSVPLYQPDILGQLRRWSYASPLDGTSGWTQQAIGIGWGGLTVVSGGDGVLYTIDSLGNLHWYQDDNFAGTGGASWSAGSGSLIGTGWGGLTTVVSGGQGVIYGIDPSGNLRWYRYLGTNGSASWAPGSGTTIGTGWSFAKVVAGGSGVIYAVKSSGALLWYRELNPLAGSASWAAAGTGGQIGSGWSGFSRIGSMGGGVLFARDIGGTMWWYRHTDPLGGSSSWANQGAGTNEGSGWSGDQSTTDVTGCVAS
ncbi:MAG: hypothetical protein AUG49_23995 [Catenulispora sp. 13_1_20CM_3_70_7]|nr:MAG: hypothetical protein AUG49_23995 [Catenulispora sp. 13_1_20CM_3_70_7]